MNGSERGSAHRRLSRETRHLLIAVVVALVSLWVLARVRFPDRPVTSSPLPPLLSQLSARPALSELAAEIGRVQNRLAGSLVVVPLSHEAPAWAGRAGGRRPEALRIRSDAVVTFLPRTGHDEALARPDLLVLDRATGLAVFATEPDPATVLPAPWIPEALETPRYLLASVASGDSVTLGPLFVPALRPHWSPAWSGPVWLIAFDAARETGAFVFTPGGELVGALVRLEETTAIVPAETLLADTQRLLQRGRLAQGRIGIQAQAVTGRLAAATGTSAGVIVTAVDPAGPVAEHVQIGDVIVALNGVAVETWEDWDVRSNRLSAGEPVVVHVRRRGEPRRIEILAAPRAAPSLDTRALGITMRFVPGLGSEAVGVDSWTAAQTAGVMPGDIITAVDGVRVPTPVQVRSAFATAESGQPVLLAISRGGTSHVLALVKP
jgi:hypothetical protein